MYVFTQLCYFGLEVFILWPHLHQILLCPVILLCFKVVLLKLMLLLFHFQLQLITEHLEVVSGNHRILKCVIHPLCPIWLHLI